MVEQYIVGHRGAMGEAPENTLKAFEIGCKSDADIIECDVHLSQDGHIIVFHDNTLERTTNGKGWVKDFPLRALKEFDAGQGEAIPTLEEVVELVQSFKKRLIIEIKGESWEEAQKTTLSVCSFIKACKMQEMVIVHSFWHESIRMVKSQIPEVSGAVIMMIGLQPQEMINLITNVHADGASIAYDYISPGLISLARQSKLFIDAWVLDYPSTFTRMQKIGVNGLITNYPSKFNL